MFLVVTGSRFWLSRLSTGMLLVSTLLCLAWMRVSCSDSSIGNRTSIAVDGAIGATAGFDLSLDQIEIRLKEMHPLLAALHKLRR